jgi:hypothetical protein
MVRFHVSALWHIYHQTEFIFPSPIGPSIKINVLIPASTASEATDLLNRALTDQQHTLSTEEMKRIVIIPSSCATRR